MASWPGTSSAEAFERERYQCVTPVKEGKRPNLRSTTASEFTTASYSLGNTFISTTAVKYITNSIVIHDRSFYIS